MTMTFWATVDIYSIRSYMPNIPVLLPASSWAAVSVPMRDPKLPDHVTQRAADCGGFVATLKWGDYRYTPQQYVNWLYYFCPQWAAMFDYCCENEITSGKKGIVRQRQDKTTAMAHHFWDTYRDAPWCWVPTIQGWEVSEYARHAQELAPLIREMAAHYGPTSAFRVGVGTLCHRASNRMIREVAQTVSHLLPGIDLHLWGIKLGALKDSIALPEAVKSIDSAMWHGNRIPGESHRYAYQDMLGTMTKRQWNYAIGLPNYQKKIERALRSPKQMTMYLPDHENEEETA